MKAREEVNRLVLTHLLNKYPSEVTLGERHWAIAYKLIRANMIADTIEWKIQNMTVNY